jgi:hypothetical protein
LGKTGDARMRETIKKLLRRSKFSDSLAVLVVVAVFSLLFTIVVSGIGGNDMMFLIVGHVMAWGEMVILFYFQHKYTGVVR